MTSAANTTATVEALTAEVRVLMVGSRQITLSVYGQLDQAADTELIPMGRVAPKDGLRGHVYVVGKHATTGALARSALPYAADEIEEWVAARSRARGLGGQADTSRRRAISHEGDAQECDEKAATLLGSDRYASAAYYASAAARAEEDAIAHDSHAEAATTKPARLKALAAAAEARWQAERSRCEEASARRKAAELASVAARHRKEAQELQKQAGQFGEAATEWGQHDTAERERIAVVAAEWQALPLIVLAGLR